jgi:hypothetical protein
MPFDAIIDVAEIDDLGYRVVAEEPRALVAKRATEPSRALKLWAMALVSVVAVGFVGNFLENRPLEAPLADADASLQRPPPSGDTSAKWPAFGHSGYRYPAGATTSVGLQVTRVPGLDGSIARLDVSGRVDGPVGHVAVELVAGAVTYGEVTRYFASAGLVAPGPYGVFDLSFAMPTDAAPGDLWVVVRAYVGDRIVALQSVAVDQTRPQLGRDKYVIDDIVDPGRHADPLEAAKPVLRMQALGWAILRFER